jgi:hypothetical protein
MQLMRLTCQLLFKSNLPCLFLTAFITPCRKTSAQQIRPFLGTNSQEVFFKTNDGITIHSTTEGKFPFLTSQNNYVTPILHIAFMSKTKI